jgi:hypothetical protein
MQGTAPPGPLLAQKRHDFQEQISAEQIPAGPGLRVETGVSMCTLSDSPRS